MNSDGAPPTSSAQVDPAWWEGVGDAEPGDPAWKSPHSIAPVLDRLAKAAQEAAETTPGDELVQRKAAVLQVVAKLASPMLVPTEWRSPYSPAIQMGGRRSWIPDDLDDDELAIVAEIAEAASPSSLKARAADVAWWYRDRRDTGMQRLAIETYAATPLDADTWYECGSDNWTRAMEISKRQGTAGRAILDQLTDKLCDRALASDEGDKWFVKEMSDFLQETDRLDKERAEKLAGHLVAIAAKMAGSDFRTSRALERQAGRWFERTSQRAASLEARRRIANLYEAEADSRIAGDGGALVADRFLEQAIKTLRELPSSFRAAHDLDLKIAALNKKLVTTREAALEQMTPLRTGPFDITEMVNAARASMTGLGPLEALAALAQTMPFQDVEKLLAEERGRYEGSIRSLFASTTYSGDARKVATNETDKTEDGIPEERIFAEAVRTFTMTTGMIVDGWIRPAIEVLTLEHRFSPQDMYNLCVDSPLVPTRHARLWARGLEHGLNGDFVSAVAILVPQIEQMLRYHLKARGAFTMHVGDGYVEMEKSINFLLELDETVETFGADLTFTLRALLCEQTGPNLRNDLAHGLIDDNAAWSRPPIYVWWLCLKLVVTTFLSVHMSEPDSETLGDEPVSDAPASPVD